MPETKLTNHTNSEENFDVKFTFRFSQEEARQLSNIAKQTHRSRSGVMRWLLSREVKAMLEEPSGRAVLESQSPIEECAQ